MAGSKLKYNMRLKASSILEVIISMIIILLVFGIAMMIATNVVHSSLSVKKLNAQALLHNVLIKEEQAKEVNTQTYTLDDFRVEQEIKAYNDDAGLTEIHLTAYDANQEKVAELQKLIINKK